MNRIIPPTNFIQSGIPSWVDVVELVVGLFLIVEELVELIVFGASQNRK